MMKLAIHASSAAVTRTLQSIATASGAEIDPAAEHVLQSDEQSISLRQGSTTLQSMSLPARPAAIARLLAAHQASNLPSLHGGWQFDATARHLSRDGVNIALTEKEALLLAQLLGAYPASCSRDALLKNVWSMQSDVETHTLETHIYRLRGKLAELNPKPCDIVTVDSAYQLTMEIA